MKRNKNIAGVVPPDEYQPIACALHEHYQLAVIKKMSLQLVWRDAGGIKHIDRTIPIDVYTKGKAEYLLCAVDDLGDIEIRLDNIYEARWVSNGILLGG